MSKATRACAISIDNRSARTLKNARWFLDAGKIALSHVDTLRPGCSGGFLFEKRPWSVLGTVGVLSFDISDCSERLAVAWAVHLDVRANVFNAAVIGSDRPSNSESLLIQLLDDASRAPSAYLRRSDLGSALFVEARMSQDSKALLEVALTEEHAVEFD